LSIPEGSLTTLARKENSRQIDNAGIKIVNAPQAHSNTADSQYGQVFGNYNRHTRFDLDVIF
jgi:hypothetical protein